MKSGASAQSPASAAGNAVFADTGSISLWAKEAVSELQAKGLISGKGNNQFDPRGEVTRAETAKLLYGLLNL